MEIKCTPQELKELMQNNTSVAGTTDVIKLNDIQINTEELAKKINYELGNFLGTRS